MLVFACISPHPPIILPNIGSPADRKKVKQTITSLELLAPKLALARPEFIVVSSPHPDWGIDVPLHFLAKNIPLSIASFQSVSDSKNLQFPKLNVNDSIAVFPLLTTLDSPKQHFAWGKEIAAYLPKEKRVAWIASGDMSHRLKEDGPYGFHPSGPKFDQEFISLLKKKNIEAILEMEPEFLEEAGECGLRSFCTLLGALDWQSSSAGLKPRSAWQPEIISYEGPFGVGYLVAEMKLH